MTKLKRALLTSLTLLCLLSAVFLTGCQISVKASPDIIHVPTDYPTIQEAIKHAHPYTTDIIFVDNGTYPENVVVYKSVQLVGEDRRTTIIDGNGTGSVISITSDNVSISGFTIQNSGPTNSDSGIQVSSSANNIGHNTLTNNTHAIHLYSSGNNLVSANNISNNEYGIFLSYSRNNTISGNNISNNDWGIRLDYSSNNNTIYHNNFIDNSDQVWCDSMNAWNDQHEGNYWSDYTGQDLNGDGIGGTPYIIDLRNQDDCPLMGMLREFNIIWQGKTHYVTTVCNSIISNPTFEIDTKTGYKTMNFAVAGENGTVGFCRVMIPTQLMNYSYIVLVDGKEIIPALLDISNKTHAYLYFTYFHSSHTITIISSRLLCLYYELLDKYHNLNSTYYEILDSYGALLGYYSELLGKYSTLNASYQELRGNHTSLLSEHTQNIRRLTYVFIATTAMFIIAAVYLSTQAHRRVSRS